MKFNNKRRSKKGRRGRRKKEEEKRKDSICGVERRKREKGFFKKKIDRNQKKTTEKEFANTINSERKSSLKVPEPLSLCNSLTSRKFGWEKQNLLIFGPVCNRHCSSPCILLFPNLSCPPTTANDRPLLQAIETRA
jgi:hypothetical protein